MKIGPNDKDLLARIARQENRELLGPDVSPKRKKQAAPGSKAEALLMLQLKLDQVQEPEREYRFHEYRKWRLDFAWPANRFAVEVEGITRTTDGGGGRHQRLAGFKADLEKYQHAMLLGWTVYRCSPSMVKSGAALDAIKQMLINTRNK